MFTLHNLTYIHPNKDVLFSNLSVSVSSKDKIALIGNNGVGKSTLLKIIAGEFQASGGHLHLTSEPYYIPQNFGQFDDLKISEALKIDKKLFALQEILDGKVSEENLEILNNDWTLEERCRESLSYWKLSFLDLNSKMKNLSGGQKTKIFLAGIQIHNPEMVLLDEPSNHLDSEFRELLYQFIQNTSKTLVVVSHDRALLNLLNITFELKNNGISVYGGNYDFYSEQKKIETEALNNDILSKEKALKKAKEKERETLERQNKLDSRGKKKQEKSGTARIMMNTMRNNAENSTAKLKLVHTEKMDVISQDLRELRSNVSETDQMKFSFDNSSLHRGKILIIANNINIRFSDKKLWNENLNFQILSRERIALKGNNASGKTTLIRLIVNEIHTSEGKMEMADFSHIYIDQDYSLLDPEISVYEQAQKFNFSAMEEHEVKIRLKRFLFGKNDWDKKCASLSGGERMRLILCCLNIQSKAPDLIILDEPTNNLDIQNVEVLTSVISGYKGSIIAVSHDEKFLNEIGIEREIRL